MKIFAEKEAENFLEKEGFDVVDRFYAKNNKDIQKAMKKILFPWVMKASGRKIIHKKSINGVRVGIRNYEQAERIFNSLKKIKNCEGIIIQKQIKGKEFLLGLKENPDFGHVIAFGFGGTGVEKKKNISFRVCPLDKKDAKELIKETKIKLERQSLDAIEKNILKLCGLVKKYPKIKELDINPLIVEKNKAIVVDARFVLD
ncbi:MAG: acetate--CoA ligase family protein [Candidatus Pacearchaeota archaeon]|nr:acetate--CoA ligase family protein [Candidatus Pacearchaeota archaeon]